MARDPATKSLTPEEAWQQLLGTWVHRVDGAVGDFAESRMKFTPARQWIRINSLAGGVLPGVQRRETVTEIVKVEVKGQAILLTLGAKSDPLARPGGVMTVQLRGADRLVIEDGPAYTRVNEAAG